MSAWRRPWWWTPACALTFTCVVTWLITGWWWTALVALPAIVAMFVWLWYDTFVTDRRRMRELDAKIQAVLAERERRRG